jgi:hypothetical protein
MTIKTNHHHFWIQNKNNIRSRLVEKTLKDIPIYLLCAVFWFAWTHSQTNFKNIYGRITLSFRKGDNAFYTLCKHNHTINQILNRLPSAVAHPGGGQLGNCPPFHNLLPTNFFEMMAIAQCQKILLRMHVRRLKLYDFNALSLDKI